MNKVLNINLGGMAFTIDDNAYSALENYLQSLHNHFRVSEGYEEIMNDIEARLAELMSEGMGKRTIISQQDVKNAISIMGKPEDFGAEPIQEEKAQKHWTTEGGKSSDFKTGKRLYRDEENKVVGGVCSGIAAYFGIEDPIWVRLAFLGLLFGFGSGSLLYFILWGLVPAAKTTADRLAMRGEPIDVNSIAKSVGEGIEKLSDKVNKFGSAEEQAKFNSQVHTLSSKIGEIIQVILKSLGGIGKLLAIIIGVLLVGSLLVGWVSAAVGVGMAYPLFSYITDAAWMPPLAIFNIFWLMAIPVTAIFLGLRRLIFKRSTNGAIQAGMWIFFTLNVISLFFIGIMTAKDFSTTSHVTEDIPLSINGDILTISALPNKYGELNTNFGSLKISEDFLLSDEIRIDVEKSETDKFELTKDISAKGRSIQESGRLSSGVNYELNAAANNLQLAQCFAIPKGTKWRDQTVRLTLKVPVGKKIQIRKNEDSHYLHFNMREVGDWDENEPCWDSNTPLWLMTEKGVKCITPVTESSDKE